MPSEEYSTEGTDKSTLEESIVCAQTQILKQSDLWGFRFALLKHMQPLSDAKTTANSISQH